MSTTTTDPRDVIARLRDKYAVKWDDCLEAASTLESLAAENARLMQERDEARSTRVGDWADQRTNDHLTIKMYEWKARAEAAEAANAAVTADRDRMVEALRKIDALDEAMGHDLRERHAFEAVNIARAALTNTEDRTDGLG